MISIKYHVTGGAWEGLGPSKKERKLPKWARRKLFELRVCLEAHARDLDQAVAAEGARPKLSYSMDPVIERLDRIEAAILGESRARKLKATEEILAGSRSRSEGKATL